jgi:cytochrome P450
VFTTSRRFAAAPGVKLQRLFENLFELRRRAPADDIISRLVAATATSAGPRTCR